MRFLHLSDIHFANYDGSPDTDLDSAVRIRMLEDIGKMHDQIGDMNAVLVVGDIAATGKRTDYDVAAEFLNRACQLVGAEAHQVVCVPGNHDIDRGQQDALHEAVRFQLRRVMPSRISKVLLALLQGENGSKTLLRPLEQYNEFALRYGCSIDHKSPLWKPKVLNLGDRNVHLHGINSAWICDGQDSFKCGTQKLVVGLFQVLPIAEDSSAISIALCHHPLRWLRDADLIKPWLARAQIVLTGHEHEPSVAISDDRRWLRIASGAVNPDQTQHGWIPAYNVIDLDLIAADRLRVQIFSRSWQGARAEFGPNQSTGQPFCCDLHLDPYSSASEAHESTQAVLSQMEHPIPADPTIVPPDPELLLSGEREMVYSVMSAGPDLRRNVARELRLVSGDDQLGGLELDKEILRRALDRHQLAELHTRIVNG